MHSVASDESAKTNKLHDDEIFYQQKKKENRTHTKHMANQPLYYKLSMYKSMCCHFDEYILINILFIDKVSFDAITGIEWRKKTSALHKQLLPAGWLAVGPSRFHVILGFGEPFSPFRIKSPKSFHGKHTGVDRNGTKNIHTWTSDHTKVRRQIDDEGRQRWRQRWWWSISSKENWKERRKWNGNYL